MIPNFHNKSKNEVSRKKILLQIACVVVFAVLVVLIIAAVKIYQDKRAMIAKIESYEKQIKDIEKSNAHLEEEINNANNEDYLEQMAYEKFDKHRPGEQEIIFVSPEHSTKSEEKQKNYWLGWVSGFWDWITRKPK